MKMYNNNVGHDRIYFVYDSNETLILVSLHVSAYELFCVELRFNICNTNISLNLKP